ncbi:MAG TPA: LD-carboxypeptidase, partial [Victivallales bacterium]|nr:LD-carboxypeptidase [Victivallales bacterium]
GFGSSDILPLINWNLLKEKKKIIMGFSDISAILLAMLKKNAGIPISGPMLSDLPQSFENNFAGVSLKKALENDSSPLRISDFCEIRSYREGKAEGKICASNLTILCSLIGTPFIAPLKNKVLLIEDINEPYHQIYRCLSQLELSGITENLSALLIGNLKNCGRERYLNEVFANFAKKHKYPVLSGIPFGHIRKIMSFNLNSRAIIYGKNIIII